MSPNFRYQQCFAFLLLTSCKTMGPPPAVSEWLSFDNRRGLIEFDVEINGVPARAALDTGATGSVLDPEFAAKAGIAMAGRGHVTVEGVSGEKRMSTAEDFTVAFVGSRGAEGAVPVQDAVILERSIGVDVLLGLQFFRRLILQVDYRNARFRYMTRSATDLAKTANTRARMDGENMRFLVEVFVNGNRQWVQLDTGNAGPIYLSRRMAQEGGWISNSKPAGEATISGVIKDAETDLMLLNAMKLGPYELNDVPIVVENHGDAHKSRPAPKLGSRVVLSEDAAPGLIGYDVLRHFVMTIDLENGLLHLQ